MSLVEEPVLFNPSEITIKSFESKEDLPILHIIIAIIITTNIIRREYVSLCCLKSFLH